MMLSGKSTLVAQVHMVSAERSCADVCLLLEERRLQEALRKQRLAIPADADRARKIADKILQTESEIQLLSPNICRKTFNALCYGLQEFPAVSAASRQRQRTHIPELLRAGRYATVHASMPEPGLTSLFDHGLQHILPDELYAMEFPRPALSLYPGSFDVEHLDVPFCAG